jgi:polyphenol oxidase
MSHDDRDKIARSTRFSPTRRQVLEGLSTAAVATSGLAGLAATPARAQDTPVDCTPIGAAGKMPVPFQPNYSLPIRIRKSAFELSTGEINRLKAAYAALRQLTTNSPNDPRGWLRQGYVHCWYCGGGSDGQAGPEIHGGWWFFPWHRAFLYFHERILCKLLGDDTFALPYWDWDSQGRQTFPPPYGDPNDPSNPLFDMLRSAKPGDAIDPSVVSAPIMNVAMNSPTTRIFLGGSIPGDAGNMENAPHGPVHIWTADTTLQAANNDMGVLDTAAQDPVFFAHHGNIDRLWTVWLGLSGANQNYSRPDWLNNAWQFYDENGVWTSIKVSDVLDPRNSLRVDWQQPSVGRIWTFTPRPAPLVAALPLGASAALQSDQAGPSAAALMVAPTRLSLGTAPVTQTVALPAPVAAPMAALETTSAPAYVLRLEGIEIPPGRHAYFNVYLNLPGASAATPVTVPNYVGTVTVLPNSKRPSTRHQHDAVNATFEITPALAQVAKGTTNLSVTLVPVGGAGAAAAAPAAAAAASPATTTVRRIYIDRL